VTTVNEEPSRLPLATSTWDDDEYRAIDRVVASGNFTMGAEVRAFEEEFASWLGVPHAIMVNSGSSANLLAVATAVLNPEIDLAPGDEVLVPAVSWATTYSPLHQYGLRLVFVDIDPDTLNIDLDAAGRAIGKRTKAIASVNLLGNPVDAVALKSLADSHNLLVIEDNCESLGATVAGVAAGTMGRFGTFSSFFSHHISTMEGGVVSAFDDRDAATLRSLRAHGWTRDISPTSPLRPPPTDEFEELFRFVLPGYNLRPTEMSGAIGRAQLSKVPSIIDGRRRNAREFVRLMSDVDGVRVQRETGESSWFGFAMTLEGPLRGRRSDIVAALRASGIEARPVVAGNFTRNPVMRFFDARISGPLDAADAVHDNGFFVGNHHYDVGPGLAKVAEIVSAHSA